MTRLTPNGLDRLARQLLEITHGAGTHVDLVNRMEEGPEFSDYGLHFEAVAERAIELRENGEWRDESHHEVKRRGPPPVAPLPALVMEKEKAERRESRRQLREDKLARAEKRRKWLADILATHPDVTATESWTLMPDEVRQGMKKGSWSTTTFYVERKRIRSNGEQPAPPLAPARRIDPESLPPEELPVHPSAKREQEPSPSQPEEKREEDSDESPQIAERMTRCKGCGIVFPLEMSFRESRMDDGEFFYCPKGCCLSFHAENEGKAGEIHLQVMGKLVRFYGDDEEEGATTLSAPCPTEPDRLVALEHRYIEVLIGRLEKGNHCPSDLCDRLERILHLGEWAA